MADRSMDKYAITGLVTIAGLHQLGSMTQAVGVARMKYGVKAPETNGPPEFIRIFRAHQNTVEFFPMSLSGLWITSTFFHPVPASLAYLGYLYSRQQYFKGYAEDAEKRIPGFAMSVRFLRAMFLMSILGVGHKVLRHFGNVDVWELISRNVTALCN